MITNVALANTSTASPNYHFLFVVRTFKIWSLSNFQVYNTALLTMVTMLCVIFPGLTFFDSHLPNFPPTHPPPVPGNYHSTLCF